MSDEKLELLKKLTNNKNQKVDYRSKSNSNNSIINKLFNYKLIITLIVCIILVVTILITYNANQKQTSIDIVSSKSQTSSISVINPKIVPKTVNEILSASGYVIPRRVSTIAAEITGRVTEIYIEEGQIVSKGELIAKLDATLAITEKEAAIAKLASAKSLVDSLKAKYKKAKFIAESKDKLFKSGVVSKEIYIKSQTEAEGLVADIAKAENDIKLAEIEITRRSEIVERHFLRSPFDGVITSKDAHPGEVISPSSGGGGFTRTGIATIVDMESLEVEVDVNEASINKVFTQQKVNIILEAYPDRLFNGSVIAIIPNANRDKATIKVRIKFINKEDIIFPNMAVKVDFFQNSTEQ